MRDNLLSSMTLLLSCELLTYKVVIRSFEPIISSLMLVLEQIVVYALAQKSPQWRQIQYSGSFSTSRLEAANKCNVWKALFVWKQGEEGNLCRRGNWRTARLQNAPLMEMTTMDICRNHPWHTKTDVCSFLLAVVLKSVPK